MCFRNSEGKTKNEMEEECTWRNVEIKYMQGLDAWSKEDIGWLAVGGGEGEEVSSKTRQPHLMMTKTVLEDRVMKRGEKAGLGGRNQRVLNREVV